MARCDTHLLGAPAERPQRECLMGTRRLLGVVVARYVTKAEEDVWEAVLFFFVRDQQNAIKFLGGLG